MPTIRMTKTLGQAISNLRQGYALTYDSGVYQIVPRNYDEFDREGTVIPEEVGKTLVKERLVTKRTIVTHQHHWWHSWFRSVWIISDVGKDFKLPPDKYWLEE